MDWDLKGRLLLEDKLLLTRIQNGDDAVVTTARFSSPSVPNPKFAISAAVTGANFGFERTLEIYDSSVDLAQKFS